MVIDKMLTPCTWVCPCFSTLACLPAGSARCPPLQPFHFSPNYFPKPCSV